MSASLPSRLFVTNEVLVNVAIHTRVSFEALPTQLQRAPPPQQLAESEQYSLRKELAGGCACAYQHCRALVAVL